MSNTVLTGRQMSVRTASSDIPCYLTSFYTSVPQVSLIARSINVEELVDRVGVPLLYGAAVRRHILC